jgi:hypothetical protein
MANDILRARKAAPTGPTVKLSITIAEIEQAAPAKANVIANLIGKAIPQFQRFGRHRQFARVTVLLTAPPPIPAGLFAAYDTFFEQRNGHPAPRQKISCRGSNNAATNNDNIHLPRQFGTGFNPQKWCRHGNL